MLRWLSGCLCLVIAVATVGFFSTREVAAQRPKLPQWIWFDEGDPLSGAPNAVRYFRRTFQVEKASAKASVEITADNRFTIYLNGERVGQGDAWQNLYRFDVRKHLKVGKNVFAVEAGNDGGPAGLVVRLRYQAKGSPEQFLLSDGQWKSSKTAGDGWQKIDFKDEKWGKARVLGPYGRVGPWGGGSGGGGSPAGPGTFTVPKGFKVVQAVKPPEDRGVFSLVNMTFDDKGRLLVSQEGGPILLCTSPDKEGVLQTVREYCTQIRNCHGMCWFRDALYLVGDGPKGTGLYRCRDTKKADLIDEVTLIHKFQGGMGEHGPHAVLVGPDGWLYLVIGNHAHASIGAKKSPNPAKIAPNSPLSRWPTGLEGPDQGRPGSTEDVLLPRLNDANGHAANIRAPGGTIWRLDPQGKNMSLVAAGFRNEFDAAFNPAGELFSYDSDMEWDEGLPWYRPVRIVHAPPGADFGWRTGASKIPPYAIDTLPPLHDTGRGSPVGVACYDHGVYPAKYRGAVFVADWSVGIIYSVIPTRKGATYIAEVDRFCTGKPLNVTDLETAPDGCLWFTMGGRGSRGGVYRIEVEKPAGKPVDDGTQQILAPWSKAKRDALSPEARAEVARTLEAVAKNTKLPAGERIHALTRLQFDSLNWSPRLISDLIKDENPEVRAHVVWLLGVVGDLSGDLSFADRLRSLPAKDRAVVELERTALKVELRNYLRSALKDGDAMVRRRACDALVRIGSQGTPIEAIWPLLGDEDRFVRTAARLLLEKQDSATWISRLKTEPKERIGREAIVTLCKSGQANKYGDVIIGWLSRPLPMEESALLDHLRTLQLVCFHVPKSAEKLTESAKAVEKVFPHKSEYVNRELAILLAHFASTKQLENVAGKLMAAIQSATGNKAQQIHYFYCLRHVPTGWTQAHKRALSQWYETTRDWRGGASYTRFLENIFRDIVAHFDQADLKAILAEGDKWPLASMVLVRKLSSDRNPELLPSLKTLAARVREQNSPQVKNLQSALEETILRTMCDKPRVEDFSDLVRGLSTSNKVVLHDVLSALTQIEARPKPEDGAGYRAVLLAAGKLDPKNRWKAVEVLRHWSKGRQFGADKGDWKPELLAWSRWFGQSFPKEPALPDVEGDKPTPSKYRYADLLQHLTTGAGKTGDVTRGKMVFEKALCSKCHRYGKEGEGLGPDLTTLVKRFKRAEVLESVYYPSKVISDQYRSTSIQTLKGQRIDGLAAVQGDMITVLQSDGTKVTLRKKEIEQQFASLVSVMPEKLLDPLTMQEIADLFAYLESDPGK